MISYKELGNAASKRLIEVANGNVELSDSEINSLVRLVEIAFEADKLTIPEHPKGALPIGATFKHNGDTVEIVHVLYWSEPLQDFRYVVRVVDSLSKHEYRIAFGFKIK